MVPLQVPTILSMEQLRLAFRPQMNMFLPLTRLTMVMRFPVRLIMRTQLCILALLGALQLLLQIRILPSLLIVIPVMHGARPVGTFPGLLFSKLDLRVLMGPKQCNSMTA